MSDNKRQGLVNSLSCSLSEPSTIHLSPFTAALLPLFLALSVSYPYSNSSRRDFTAEGEEDAEEEKEETLFCSQLITSHWSQITVERSETQHKGTKAQRSEGRGSDE